jgi:hypothetical protein
MNTIIRVNLTEIIASGRRVCLELGCGAKKKQGCISVDKADLSGVDIGADLEQGLPFFPDCCADEIHCTSVLEHIDNFELLMREKDCSSAETGWRCAYFCIAFFQSLFLL